MTRLFILLFALVICAIAITRFWEKAGSRTEPKAENQKSYVTRNRTCIIFIMELWVLTAFFAFVPVLGSALTVALGMMRANIPITVLAMAIGKVIRYALVIAGTLGIAALL